MYKKIQEAALDKIMGELNDIFESEKDDRKAVDTAIEVLEKMLEKEEKPTYGTPWDFGKGIKDNIFAQSDDLVLKPITEEFYDSYFRTREAYFNLNAFNEVGTTAEEFFGNELVDEKRFCVAVIRKTDSEYVGYVGINDTTKNLWEICAEFLPQYCNQGYGYSAMRLFIKRVSQITGDTTQQFQALVEVDNIASQNLMRKLNGRLIDIYDCVFHDENRATEYEERHLDEITPHMIQLADELMTEPRKLLSHVLDYRIFAEKI